MPEYSIVSMPFYCSFWSHTYLAGTILVPTKIWKALLKPKCEFFVWLVLHGKVITAGNLAIWGWPHDPICKLCMALAGSIQKRCSTSYLSAPSPKQ